MPEPEDAGTSAEARYKVGEICRLADVQPYVLRYWENEFPVLAGDKSQSGPRMYSERDLTVIQRIKTLLYVEGFTIAGAKKRLESELKSGAAETGDTETAPVPVAATSPKDAAETKPRRGRTRPVAVAAEEEQPQIFEEEVLEASPDPETVKRARDPRTGVVAPAASDPRLPRVVSELKKILEILSREV